MNKIILLVTHGPTLQNTIDLIEVLKLYGKVIVLADEEQAIKDVEVRIYPNEGYDFGKIYRFFQEPAEKRITNMDMLCITNDTISPVASFDDLFKKSEEYEFYGATDGYSWHPDFRDVEGYHIQSFFHIFRGNAIEILRKRYVKNGIKTDKEAGVLTYEMGVSKLMIEKKVKMGVMIPIKHMMHKYGWKRYEPMIYGRFLIEVEDPTGELNATFSHPIQYLEEGLPFVKNSMFQYHFRPMRFLYWITKKAMEKNVEKVMHFIKTIINHYNLWKECRGYIIYMCSIILKKQP